MIFCNLKVLLAQRNISISKMSADTNISRTTLTALCSNKSGGIQFETLDTICSYLKILPDELILFSPYLIKLSIDRDNLLDVYVLNRTSNRSYLLTLIPDIDGGLYFNHFIDEEKKFEEFKKIISSLPKYYIYHLENSIKDLYLDIAKENKIDLSFFSIETDVY